MVGFFVDDDDKLIVMVMMMIMMTNERGILYCGIYLARIRF